MDRSLELEIMDRPDLPDDELQRVHQDLRLIHRLMRTADALVRRVNGARSILDIGCGDGALLAEIGRRTGAAVQGVDLRPQTFPFVNVVQADAARDPLPRADAAVCTLLLHHLTRQQTLDLIRNVGRSCRRFVILDLVRHRLPLALFSLFISPLLSRVAAADGKQSIRRAYTAGEMRGTVEEALQGTGATFEQWVSPYWARQIVTITYP